MYSKGKKLWRADVEEGLPYDKDSWSQMAAKLSPPEVELSQLGWKRK